MSASTQTHDTRFDAVVELLHEQLARDPQPHGAALAVEIDGRPVIDTWAGSAAPGRPWAHDTRAIAWSATKGISAAAVMLLHDRGELDVDATVASVWPEYAAAGKDATTIAEVLSHRARQPWWQGFERTVRLEEAWGWDRPREIAAALAAAEPTLAPGEASYHGLTFGWLVDEIVLRATGRDMRAVVEQELAPAFGVELRLGWADGNDARVAPLVPGQPRESPEVEALLSERVPGTPAGSMLLVTTPEGAYGGAAAANHPRFSAAPQPGCNARVDARALARLYSGVVAGDRIGSGAFERFMTPAWVGEDVMSGLELRYGIGFRLDPEDEDAFAPGVAAFGHQGWGGSTGFAIPSARIGFGYVTNRMELGDGVDRAFELVDAILTELR